MKSFRIKSIVSLLLTFMMLVSVCTVGFVNTAAAEADVAQTGATITGGTTFYLKPNTNWKSDGARFAAYFCNGSSAAKWYSAYGPNEDDNYWVTVNDGESHANIIWCRMNGANTTNSWDSSVMWNQTNDLTWDGSKNLYTVAEGAWSKGSGSWSSYTPSGGSTDPTEPTDPVPGEEITVYFLDYTDTQWVNGDDANIYVGDTKMTETVDTKNGHRMWYATVTAASSYTFTRRSYIDSNTKWNTWTASSRGTNTVYKATGSGAGSWQAASTVNAADPKDIENFWDDLWIAPADKNDVDHAVKVYYDGSEFNLFVPSYYDLSNVVVYSDHESVVIGGTTIASGSTASLTTGLDKTFQFIDGSTTTSKPKLNIYQTTGVAAMMMTTKEELYTGLAGAYASDVSTYKDAIETKGSYYFYTEDGELLNADDQVLKKIKGRGNSSFEASMRIYGKYAYNFNLDTKQELIDGSTASKKWCMLANNVDHSMMRNTFIYQLADDLGMSMGPETRLVDVYDNGKYLGAFVITEKVEYGKNTLMAKDSLGNKINNLDDGNVDANSVFTADGEDYLYEFDTDDLDAGTETTMTVGGQTYKYKYYATYDRPEVTDDDGNVLVEAADNLPFVSPEDYNTKYNYLLEHELSSRFTAEASWFVTPKGQPVVVKYPEFANQEQMQWIINEYAAMEQAVYASGEEDLNEIGELIDVDSFAKMYLIHELAINLDSCATSYYIHNEYIDGKSVLFAGPTWDFDWAMGAYAGNTKWIYNGSSVVSSANMSNPEQMFAKNKAIKTDASASNGVSWSSNYNLQAKLAHNDAFWTECQRIWTNDMAPLLYSYLIDDYSKETDTGIIVDEWLPKFQSSMDMNNARWGVYTFTGDDWGTKVTSDYSKGTGLTATSNFKIGNTGTSGSASKCYANTVYYLNDWLSTRKDYMSGTGDLYNADLLETYEFSDVTFTGEQDADDDTKLRVTPSATVTMNGEAVADTDIEYTIYVNDKAIGTFNYPTAQIIDLTDATNVVYIEVSVKDSDESAQSDTQTFEIYVPNYTVENVEFTAVQSDDGSKITVTPTADVKLDGVALELAEYKYTIYVNGNAVVTNLFTTPTVDVNLVDGEVSSVYVEVSPIAAPNVTGTSAKQNFSYNVEIPTVEVTLKFKSSSSYRYVPTVQVGKNDAVAMTKDGNKIAANASQTQQYFWYTATVEIPVDGSTTILFTNQYSMRANISFSAPEAGKTYYFGCDNMNNGTTAVDITDLAENLRNFVKSATNMLTNDPEAAGVATTSLDGTIYKMGDTDVDNTVSVMDATNIQLALVEKTELSQTGKALSDYDLDGDTSIMDATNIQTYLVQ